jgi:SAM-dependent methyltransferase
MIMTPINRALIDVDELMSRIREEVHRRKAAALSTFGKNGEDSALSQERTAVPALPAFYVSASAELNERFQDLTAAAVRKTDVDRRIPKLFRRLFRKQGGFNKLLLQITKLLFKAESRLQRRDDEIVAYLTAQNDWLRAWVEAFELERGEIRRFEKLSQQLEEKGTDLREMVSEVENDLRDAVDESFRLNERLTALTVQTENSTERINALQKTTEKDHSNDAFYLAFENKFRGTQSNIRQRVLVYLPWIKKARAGSRNAPVLDLGCGRGEWLEVLREKKLVGRGVDFNEFMVAECAERGLAVEQADVLVYLGSLPANSQGAITAFHLIEHLPFRTLLKLFAESLRVLRPGGVCIFETPNPRNILVGACDFYLDMTHENPIHPDSITFALDLLGFREAACYFLSENEDGRVAIPIGEFTFDKLESYVTVPRDFAVIARKL